MFRAHFDICVVDNKPAFLSICGIKLTDPFAVVVKRLGLAGNQQQEGCAKDAVGPPPYLEVRRSGQLALLLVAV